MSVSAQAFRDALAAWASGVTIVALGGLLLPALVKDGYSDKFALGLVTGSGRIGLLFPPSIPVKPIPRLAPTSLISTYPRKLIPEINTTISQIL